MRTVLMPTPGDPFLVAYWAKHAETWRDRYDRLIVAISWPQSPEVMDAIRDSIASIDGEVLYGGNYFTHGITMEALLGRASDGYIMFTEDDVYIRDPNAVTDVFEKVESGEYDMTGVPRGSMSMNIYQHGQQFFPGPGLWPLMLCAHSSRFRALTQTFDAKVWRTGERVVGIDYVAPEEEVCADTFGAAAMEMQVGAKLYALPSFSVLGHHIPGQVAVGTSGGYVHVGSLSSGPWPERTGDLDLQPPSGWDSWAVRTGWWERYWKFWPGGLDTVHAEYGKYVARLVDKFGRERVDNWAAISQSLVTWPE